jgi:crotonobetainyl-CoA:carnitine CoA-transferase CaiB-like acyl-CoA transferase
VIKLEPPGGDMSRPIARTYFYCVNFNKRSICVDTQTDAGKSVVQKIASTADALIANLRTRATERMGVGPAVNPQLIETHMTGYGWTGPYAKRPGIDPLAQALMGLSRAQGGPDNPPVFPAQLAPTDYTNGAMGALGTIQQRSQSSGSDGKRIQPDSGCSAPDACRWVSKKRILSSS